MHLCLCSVKQFPVFPTAEIVSIGSAFWCIWHAVEVSVYFTVFHDVNWETGWMKICKVPDLLLWALHMCARGGTGGLKHKERFLSLFVNWGTLTNSFKVSTCVDTACVCFNYEKLSNELIYLPCFLYPSSPPSKESTHAEAHSLSFSVPIIKMLTAE